MRCTLTLIFTLGIVSGQAMPDSQTTLEEIRSLRSDLRNTAAAGQRAQIVMFRLLFQAWSIEKASQRLEMARGQCESWEQQQKMAASQIEQMKKGSRPGTDQKAMEDAMANAQAQLQASIIEAQQCPANVSEADALYRAEQAKKGDLEAQLERLDQILAAAAAK